MPHPFVTPILPPKPNTTTSGFHKQGDSKPWGGEYGSASELGGMLRKSAVLHSSHLHWREMSRQNHCSSRGQETERFFVLCVFNSEMLWIKFLWDYKKFSKKKKKENFYQLTPNIRNNKWQNGLPLLENLWRKWGSFVWLWKLDEVLWDIFAKPATYCCFACLFSSCLFILFSFILFHAHWKTVKDDSEK